MVLSAADFTTVSDMWRAKGRGENSAGVRPLNASKVLPEIAQAAYDVRPSHFGVRGASTTAIGADRCASKETKPSVGSRLNSRPPYSV